MEESERQELERADKKRLQKFVEQYREDTAIGSVARARLATLRHKELLPKPWYQTGLGWIAFLTLLATLIGILIALIQ
jgi:hypothetical protein